MGDVQKIEKMTYPNKVAEKAKVIKEFNENANFMSQTIVDEFLPLCDIPHASGHVDEMREYLLN